MLPSQTVENYLKTIYLGAGRSALERRPRTDGSARLCSRRRAGHGHDDGEGPGSPASCMTSLYAGVRLTASGEKLASLVLRRHRLIELFLVKVLGMSWAEVHDEAEQLEHAVSERLIERVDDMLGRPEVDPHGDPIPTATGTISRPKHLDLLKRSARHGTRRHARHRPRCGVSALRRTA